MTLPTTPDDDEPDGMKEVLATIKTFAAQKAAPATAPAARIRAADDFRAWRKQTIAELLGLPRVCVHRRCRRRRRCAAPDAPCVARHRTVVRDRLCVLLGYQEKELFADDNDDLTW
ncbi:MAG: hypothetical protein ACKVP4_09555 [Hyphomicrobium sp.]